jgi:hypothetical protein
MRVCKYLSLMLVIGFASGVPGASDAFAQSVSFSEKKGLDVDVFSVKGAEGSDEKSAVQAARVLALQKAGEMLGGTLDEKAQIAMFLVNAPDDVLAMATLQRITRRMWGDRGPILDARVLVNTKDLRVTLQINGQLSSTKQLAKSLGNPQIMILYSGLTNRQATREETQLGEVVTNFITSFFTQRRWNVVDRKQVERAREKMKAQGVLAGLPPDPQAQLAMLTGADIYMEFSVVTTNARGKKANVSIKAFDTATSQVRAASAADSREYPAGAAWASIMQEALGNSMPAIFENLRGYWLEDAAEGRPVFLVIDGDWSDRARYKNVRSALKEMGTWEKREKTNGLLTGTLRFSGDIDDLSDDLEDALVESGFSEARFILETRSMLRIQAVSDGF